MMSNTRETSQQEHPLTKANILKNNKVLADQDNGNMSDESIVTDTSTFTATSSEKTNTSDTGISINTSQSRETLYRYSSDTSSPRHGQSYNSIEDLYNSSNSNTSSILTDHSESRLTKVTRSVQSYLKATSSARNNDSLSPYQMARVKRLNQNYRRGKLNTDSGLSYDSKFDTKNPVLKQLLINFNTIHAEVQLITDLKSKAISLSAANSRKIQNLFTKHECYLTTMQMPVADNFDLENFSSRNKHFEYINPEILPKTEVGAPHGETFRSRQDPEEFFTCPLCNHCLSEPITLICGCTFCTSCLKEYNAFTLHKSAENEMKKMTYNSSTSSLTGMGMEESGKMIKKSEYDCFNCGRVHEKNTPSDLKANTMISLLVEKLWRPNMESKRLRNEIRNYVVFDIQNNGGNKFNLEKYEYLFKQAYDKDQSNHLILADLYMINHFSGHYEKSLQYANQIIELKPKWTFGYFLKSICNEKLEDFVQLKLSLEACLSLDPSLSLLVAKLEKLNQLKVIDVPKCNSKSHRHSQKSRRTKRSLDGHTIDLREPPCLSNTLRDKTFKKKLLQLKTSSSEDFEAIADNKTFDLTLKINDNSIRKLTCESSSPSTSIPTSQDISETSKPSDNLTYTGDKDIFGDKQSEIDNDFTSFADQASELTAMTERLQNQSQRKRSISNEKVKETTTPSLKQKNKLTKPLDIAHSEPVAESNHMANFDVMSFICEVNVGSSKQFIVDPELLKLADVECSLCYRILYNPVTTPCGHSYCSSCLDRSLDHQDKCPLCKSSLDEYLAERRKFVTQFLERLIKRVFQVDFEEREKTQNEELQEFMNNDDEVPIFVCTLALPFAPCPLHIYEPRYRLMLRRAIESGSRQFGMCMYGEGMPYHFNEYGCMLEIRNYQFTRDGRAVVATVGGRRFKVLKVHNKDGYYVAKVQWVTDVRVTDETEKAELQSLHDEVFQLSLNWYNSLPTAQKRKIKEIYGISDMPSPDADIQADNGPVWHWFLLNILPLENELQYRFLTKTSLKERLKQIKRIALVLLTPHASRPKMSSQNNMSNTSTTSNSNNELNANPASNSNSFVNENSDRRPQEQNNQGNTSTNTNRDEMQNQQG